MISIKNLSYVYPDGTQALHEVTLGIPSGACMGIIGPNGAGKSTLVCHLNGFYLPQNGQITINDLELTKKNLEVIRRTVGLIFQNPDDQLFMPSLSEDVAFGPRNLGVPEIQIQQRLKVLLERFGLWELRNKAPFHLSQGQKRFAAFSSILIMNPSILVMDEPTSDLDPRNRRHLIDLVRELAVTRLIVSHDLDFLWDCCDTIALFNNGHVVEQGDCRSILADQALLESNGLELPLRLQ